jgi:hypothetical protein
MTEMLTREQIEAHLAEHKRVFEKLSTLKKPLDFEIAAIKHASDHINICTLALHPPPQTVNYW